MGIDLEPEHRLHPGAGVGHRPILERRQLADPAQPTLQLAAQLAGEQLT
jgi:hypothetical protein